MAKLSQKQLEEMAKKNKEARALESRELKVSEKTCENEIPQSKMINEIMGDKGSQLYKYSLPETALNKGGVGVPYVEPKEFPELNIKGKASRSRQAKPINFFPLEEINLILKEMSSGNKNATLNFLIWVGLQTLKGINQPIDIRVHDDTYADGTPVDTYIEKES